MIRVEQTHEVYLRSLNSRVKSKIFCRCQLILLTIFIGIYRLFIELRLAGLKYCFDVGDEKKIMKHFFQAAKIFFLFNKCVVNHCAWFSLISVLPTVFILTKIRTFYIVLVIITFVYWNYHEGVEALKFPLRLTFKVSSPFYNTNQKFLYVFYKTDIINKWRIKHFCLRYIIFIQ